MKRDQGQVCTYIHIMRACVCACSGLSNNGVTKGCGHVPTESNEKRHVFLYRHKCKHLPKEEGEKRTREEALLGSMTEG